MYKKTFRALSFVIAIFISNNGLAQDLTWGATSDLSDTFQKAINPKIATSTDGTRATAVWLRWDIIQSASATISGNTADWGNVKDLSIAGQAVGELPDIALSDDGTKATAVWRAFDSTFGKYVIQSASATISGNTADWGDVKVLSDLTLDANIPQIALSSDGTMAMVVWSTLSVRYFVAAIPGTISGNTATWGVVKPVSPELEEVPSYPEIAISSDGTKAMVVWSNNGIIQSRAGEMAGAGYSEWSPVTNVLSEAGRIASSPRIANSSDGTKATVVWYRLDGSDYRVQAIPLTRSGWAVYQGAVKDLSAPGQDAYYPQIALSSDGTKATAVWYRYNGFDWIVQSASTTISGLTATWGTVKELSAPGGDAYYPQIALSSDGTQAAAVWRRFDGSKFIVQSASATISGATAKWGIATDLSIAGKSAYEPHIDLSSDGTMATIVWTLDEDPYDIVQSASAIGNDGNCYVIKASNGNIIMFCL